MTVEPERGGEAGEPNGLGLRWRIKDSFVRYVVGNAGGRYSLTGGADLVADRYFAFPFAENGPDALPRFAGGVAFRAHGGMLRVAIVDPALRELDGRTVLTVGTGEEQLAIATLDIPAHDGGWVGAVPRLTEPGCDLFGGGYELGEPLDPLESWSGIPRSTTA